MQHDHCSHCGSRWPARTPWPRTCSACGETTWSNPIPVAVVLLPVRQPGGATGIVVIRRDIEPARGQLALPGGFIETGESWKQAAVRELREETGLLAEPHEVQLFDVGESTSFSLSIFALLPVRDAADLPPSAATEEVTEWLVATEGLPLAFDKPTVAIAA